MAIDLTGISVFLAVAEMRSFRAAAEHLGVTRPAVSQTIRRLEDRLGVSLVQRTTRSVQGQPHLGNGRRHTLIELLSGLGQADAARRSLNQ